MRTRREIANSVLTDDGSLRLLNTLVFHYEDLMKNDGLSLEQAIEVSEDSFEIIISEMYKKELLG